MCSLRHFVWNFCEKFLIGVVEIFKRTFVGITCSLWHFDGSAEIFAIFDLCLITARAGHILFVLPLFKLVQQQDGVSWWQRSSEHVLDVPDNVTPEAAEPVVLARAAAAEMAAVRLAPQVSLRHLAGCDGRRPSSCFDSLQRHNGMSETSHTLYVNTCLFMSVKMINIRMRVTNTTSLKLTSAMAAQPVCCCL